MNYDDIQNVLINSDCLFSGQAVRLRRRMLANRINQAMSLRNELHVVTIMNGGMMFAAELVEHLDMPITMGYIHLSRYGESEVGSEHYNWIVKPSAMREADVLLLDDIYDQGMTLSVAKDACLSIGAKSVTTAVLCIKLGIKHQWALPDYWALEVPNRFVYGSGMDYKGYLRNQEGIWAIKEGV